MKPASPTLKPKPLKTSAAQKPFAVFDIDGTLIRWQLYHAIADQLVKLSYVEPGAYNNVQAARMEWKRRSPGASFRTYEIELIKTYEQVLKNITTEQLEVAVQAAFDEYKDQVYTYTRNLIEDLKRQGYMLFAISGSHSEIVELIAKHYRFDDFIGTLYERDGQKFTGQSIVGSHDKSSTLKKLIKKHGVNFDDSIAAGDSKSDSAMLELVERPIAFNPDKELFEIAKTRGWKIVLERKNMVYELESSDGKYQLVKAS